jgi:hypothetical protein
MLRVTVELIPNGDEEGKRKLAQLDIVNDGTGTAWNGHYDVLLTQFERDGTAFVTTERLRDFDRDMPALHLVSDALSAVSPIKRTMSSFPRPPAAKPPR